MPSSLTDHAPWHRGWVTRRRATTAAATASILTSGLFQPLVGVLAIGI